MTDGASADGGSDAGTGPLCEQPSPGGVWGAISSKNNPLAVEGIAPGEVWGVGKQGVVRWSGADWVGRYYAFTSSPYVGLVRGTAADNIWVTNGLTTIVRWDGLGWTDISPPDLPSNAQSVEMRVLSASEAWVLYTVPPQSGTLVLHRDGNGWSQIPLPPEAALVPNVQLAELQQLWATSPRDVWIGGRVFQLGVGTTAALLHWDGTTLATVPGSPFSPDGLYYTTAIWAAAANDVWIGGTGLSSSAATLQHFDGVHWASASPSPTTAPVSIWGWCSTSVWAEIGGEVLHFDGTAWTSTGAGDGAVLSGTGPDDVWLSGPMSITNVRHWQPNSCGDGVLGPGETCDPPRGPSTSGGLLCGATCQVPACGNGVIDPGETCDPPNRSTCDDSCESIPIVCGNDIVQPGETCDFPSTRACVNCALTTCGTCWSIYGGGATVCSGLDLPDTVACNQLVGCALNNPASCGTIGYGATACYCGTDGTCSAGALGPCAAQFNALAHSNDPSVVLSLITNSSSPVERVAAAASAFGKAPCGLICYMQ